MSDATPGGPLASGRRPLSYDQLADIVWDETLPPQWKSALAPVVSRIRSLITTTGLDGQRLLTSSGGAHELLLPADIWVDLEVALRRLDSAGGAIRHNDHATVASSILRRPFLAGVEILATELNASPSPDTLRLAEDIRGNETNPTR